MSTHCPLCGNLSALDDHSMIKVHFAAAVDIRPCPGSFRNSITGRLASDPKTMTWADLRK